MKILMMCVAAGFLLAGCTRTTTQVVRGDRQIQGLTAVELCNAAVNLESATGQRLASIEAEITHRRLSCDKVMAEAGPVVVSPSAPAAVVAAGSLVRATGAVNMRAGPGTRHAVLGTLRAGDEVTVLSVQGTWCECMASGRRVFISCRLLATPAGGWARFSNAGTTIPQFSTGTPYPSVRASLVSLGWAPYQLGGSGCVSGDARCGGFTETIFCAGTGQATCWYAWRRGTEYLLVAGVGEASGQAFGELRRCSRIAMSNEHPWQWCISIERGRAAPSIANPPTRPADQTIATISEPSRAYIFHILSSVPTGLTYREARRMCEAISGLEKRWRLANRDEAAALLVYRHGAYQTNDSIPNIRNLLGSEVIILSSFLAYTRSGYIFDQVDDSMIAHNLVNLNLVVDGRTGHARFQWLGFDDARTPLWEVVVVPTYRQVPSALLCVANAA